MESHKFADIFPMIEGEELEQLKSDIKEQGLLQPIILYEGKILDGRNRNKACEQLGIKPEFKNYEGNKPLEFVISENLKRRHLTASQRAVIAVDIMPMLEEEARKRRKDTEGRPSKLVVNLPPVNKKAMENKSSTQAGKLANVGEKYVRDIKKLRDEGRKNNIEEIRSGKKTLQDIKKEDRLIKIKKQREDLDKTILEKPTGEFDVIVIDPPWKYDGDKYKEQEDGLPAYCPNGFRGSAPYITMSLEEIKNINLPAKEDCVLWLWTTNTFLPDCYPLLKEWGFELKSMVTWDKEHIGTGRWLRSQTEHCLLAIKGTPFFNNTKWSTLIKEKRTTHSTKPEIFYKMVDEICAGRKLDYFARKKRKGWDVYGDEI